MHEKLPIGVRSCLLANESTNDIEIAAIRFEIIVGTLKDPEETSSKPFDLTASSDSSVLLEARLELKFCAFNLSISL